MPEFFWNNGLPWRDLYRRASWRCRLREKEAIELRPAKPGLGQGMMESWNTGEQGYTERLQQNMVTTKAQLALCPGDQYFATPILHQCCCFLQAEPITADRTQGISSYRLGEMKVEARPVPVILLHLEKKGLLTQEKIMAIFKVVVQAEA